MSKFTILLLVTLMTASLILAAPNKKSSCLRHGDPCVSDSECCTNMRCHRYANRCQVQITEAELMAQREKILGVKGKSY